jgi:hypothetical protein
MVLVLALMIGSSAIQETPAAVAGYWLGSIDTNRGQMEIGLDLSEQKGKLVGVLKTAHGDWAVTDVREKDGVWTVAFKGDSGAGKLIGKIKDGAFTGDWDLSPHATGTFELKRAKKKT